MKTKGIPAVVMLLAGFGHMHHWNCTAYGNGCFYQDIACGFNYFLFIRMHCETGSDKTFKEMDDLKKTGRVRRRTDTGTVRLGWGEEE